ncbi:MAG: hypothetical protein JWO78_331 [Micavibrio sp.]|nr:hypothetical protein [Micavibrio sp.]
MCTHGLGYSFAVAASMDQRTRTAKKALMQPDATAKYLGAATDGFNVTFARLEVTSGKGDVQVIEASPWDIEIIRKNPAFPQSLHTVLCQAQYKIEEFKKAEELQRREEWEKTVASIKKWARKVLPF